MHDVLERRYTNALISSHGAGSLFHLQRASLVPTPSASEQGSDWVDPLRLFVQGRDADTVIEANQASAVGSAVALATSWAIVGSLAVAKSAAQAGSISVQRAQGGEYTAAGLVVSGALYSGAVSVYDFAGTAERRGLDYTIRYLPLHSLPLPAIPVAGPQVVGATWWEKDSFAAAYTAEGDWSSGSGSVQGQETELALPYFVYASKVSVDRAIKQLFNDLVSQWRAERSKVDSGTGIFVHQAYQKIIGLGIQVVPFILQELERELDHWFWALAAITREDPVPSPLKGNMLVMREYWLSWGRRQGYRW